MKLNEAEQVVFTKAKQARELTNEVEKAKKVLREYFERTGNNKYKRVGANRYDRESLNQSKAKEILEEVGRLSEAMESKEIISVAPLRVDEVA